MSVKAALLSAPAASGKGLFVRIDEFNGPEWLTDRHLPQIRACDLPPERYLWIADERKHLDGTPVNEYGGAFWDIIWMRFTAATRTKARESHAAKSLVAPEFRNSQVDFLIDYLETHDLLRG